MATIEKVVPFNKINLKDEIKTSKINYNGTEIELRNPTTNDIYDLIMITLQKANVNGFYNPYLIDIYFHLNLVYTFAKITFSAEDRADEFELYDKLNNSGLMQMIIDAISNSTYMELQRWVEDVAAESQKYNMSVPSLIKSVINDLPRQAEAAAEIINNFDPDKFSAVRDFAIAANGGRTITVSSNADKTE